MRLNWLTPLFPVPRLHEWEYRQLFEKGIRPLSESEPYAVANILTASVDQMIRLRTQETFHEQEADEDLSEAWCRRLGRVDDSFEQSSNVLMGGLTFACERVFETLPGSVTELVQLLRSRQWKIFKRLRHHLYARFPNEETKPWIRDFLLQKDDYSHSKHGYEFQQMVRTACEHFGEDFLTKEERVKVFDAILSGPPKRSFHHMQLKPFSSVLFGTYAAYFRELEGDGGQQISDDSYLLFGDIRTGAVLPQSPRSADDLARCTDSELLDYINQWDAEYRHEGQRSGEGGLVEVTIESLADAFKTAFREYIMLDDDRFRYWIEHLEAIERTIYVRATINGMHEYIKDGKLNRVEESFAACEWVLSHSDDDPADGFREGEQSRGASHWRNSRRAVVDFLETCLKEESQVSLTASGQLAKLLDMLCKQFDWRLDNNEPVRLDGFDPYDEAINNTRSRALRSLFQFGFWLKNHDPEADTSIITNTLAKRFARDAEFPLTLPEYAILGQNFVRILVLDGTWATDHEVELFPQHNMDRWRAAFGSLLRFTPCHSQVFEALRSQFWFAVENLPYQQEGDDFRSSLTNELAQHLFIYYLRGLYPLRGSDSPLERFYRKASGNPERWRFLFRQVGFILRSTEDLDQDSKDRFIEFFEWRLNQGEPQELKEFSFWLESACLDAEWRLTAFSRTLDLSQPARTEIHGEVETLSELVCDHPARVVECFAKLTDNIENDAFNIRTEPATAILKVGLESVEEDVRKNAERAHDNLLTRGRSDLLHLGN